MKTFQIITDSSCDLPQELADKLELLVLPLHFTIGGKTYANYLDGREIGFHDFFELHPPGRSGIHQRGQPRKLPRGHGTNLAAGAGHPLCRVFLGLKHDLSVRVHRSGRSARKIPRAQDSDGRQPVRVSGAGLIRLPRARCSSRRESPSRKCATIWKTSSSIFATGSRWTI